MNEELKHRDYESFKNSKDPDERMAYWISQLSPHNVWKAVIELKKMRGCGHKWEPVPRVNGDIWSECKKCETLMAKSPEDLAQPHEQ